MLGSSLFDRSCHLDVSDTQLCVSARRQRLGCVASACNSMPRLGRFFSFACYGLPDADFRPPNLAQPRAPTPTLVSRHLCHLCRPRAVRAILRPSTSQRRVVALLDLSLPHRSCLSLTGCVRSGLSYTLRSLECELSGVLVVPTCLRAAGLVPANLVRVLL